MIINQNFFETDVFFMKNIVFAMDLFTVPKIRKSHLFGDERLLFEMDFVVSQNVKFLIVTVRTFRCFFKWLFGDQQIYHKKFSILGQHSFFPNNQPFFLFGDDTFPSQIVSHFFERKFLCHVQKNNFLRRF